MEQRKEFDTMFDALDDSGRRYVMAVLRCELERIRRGRRLPGARLQLVCANEVVSSLPKSQINPLAVSGAG